MASGPVVSESVEGPPWPRRGFAVRPVAVPPDVDDPGLVKASGVVVLPRHVRWSDPPRSYDLTDRKDLLSAYEQVMSEGDDNDVRRFVDVDVVLELWDDMVLPERVRRAWASWFRAQRGLDLAC